MSPRTSKISAAIALVTLGGVAGCAGEPADDVIGRAGQQPASALMQVERVAYASDGLPYFMKGRLAHIDDRIDDVAEAQARMSDTLAPIASEFQLRASDLVATRVTHDRRGMTHAVYAQRKAGLPVVGGDLAVHIAPDGTVRSVNSTARDGIALSPHPAIERAAAEGVAVAETAEGRVDVGTTDLVYVITTGTGEMHLAWEVEVIGHAGLLVHDYVYVDAHTGLLVDRWPQVFTARSREVYDAEGRSFPILWPPAPQIASEGSPPDGDDIALAAYDNTGATYDCYEELFGRDSYDDGGAVLSSVVHVTFSVPGQGSTGNNAAWALNQMVYGDGDGEFMGPTPYGFDVTAHELTHGVISSSAQLAYQNESGALNEGMADILAAVCEAWRDGSVSAKTWLIGEDIFTPGTPDDALRYMDDPTLDSDLYPPELGGSRDFYADRYQGQQDNGGVHLNSGIANLAFKLLVTGGSHPQGKTTFSVPAIGMEKAGQIFQAALTQGYMTSTTNFAQARTVTEEVAGTLFGAAEVTAVGMAWAAVGVGQPPAVDEVPPTVSIVSPADGATVAAGFEVEVEASDDQGVVGVELSIDGTSVGTVTSAPYVFTTDAGLAPGSHTITATARDAFNEVSDTITITVSDTGCTTDDQCPDGERCGNEGVCVPENDPGQPQPDAGTGSGGGNNEPDPMTGGCGCAAGNDAGGAAGTLLLALGLLLAVRRRRA